MGNTSSRATIEKEKENENYPKNEINKNNDKEIILEHNNNNNNLQLIDILRDDEFWLDA